MKLNLKFWRVLRQFNDLRFNPGSLQFRLTLEIGLLASLSLAGIALWMSWKVQQILIVSHQQNVEYISARFPRDLELYSDMVPLATGLQKTIENIALSDLWIWVRDNNGSLIAQSKALNPTSTKTQELIAFADMPLKPQVYQVRDRYLMLMAEPLMLRGQPLGKVYMALDVTMEQQQLNGLFKSLLISSLLILGFTIALIALRIRRGLQPLADMSRMARIISAADLSTTQLLVVDAPSEVKELAQTFNMMLSRLSAAWEQQRQFVSNVSHELRTPLTVVFGFLQSVLRRGTNLNDYQREALETAASEADRTVRLLQDLLELARADSGYMQFYLEPLVLNDLIAEVVGMTEHCNHRTITIEASKEMTAIADRDRLKQVLLNLIDNAVKYSDPEQPITLKLNSLAQESVIQVCDRGIGIPLQSQARIFERFYRLDESRSRATGGHGLGLAIVKTLVEGMGGKISLQSSPRNGSIFTITLPTTLTATDTSISAPEI